MGDAAGIVAGQADPAAKIQVLSGTETTVRDRFLPRWALKAEGTIMPDE